MKMSKLVKRIVRGDELKQKIVNGIEQVYETARDSYGPVSGNSMIELQYGDPLVSHDGVTNVEKIYLEDPVENGAARILIQASKKNNRKVGDGTTGVVILAYHLYRRCQELIAAGYKPVTLTKQLQETATIVIGNLDKIKKPATGELLKKVAMISSGDEAIGHMIADVISEIGTDGGVTVEDFAGVGIFNEIVDGFYWRKGFTSVNLANDPANLESRHTDADIFITDKRMNTATDIVPVLEKVVNAGGKELILVGDVSEEVLGILLLNRMKGIVNVVVTDLPIYGPMRSLALEDLACVTGGTVYTAGANASDFDISMLGGAKSVIINEFSTTILGGEGDKDTVEGRLVEIRRQLSESENPSSTEAIRDRLARLTGKVAIIRVGGATEVEQKEVKLRVEDAICAVQAAIKEGVVPGGGVALAHSGSITSLPGSVECFNAPLRILAENAGLSPDRAVWKLMEHSNKHKDLWAGYDFSEGDDIVNTLEEGIVDPTSVVKEIVQNATSVVSKLITINNANVLIDRSEKRD